MGSIRVAQIAQGYVTALKRDGCRNCTHVADPLTGGGFPLRCELGGFGTTPHATCRMYKRSEGTQQGQPR